MTVALMQAVNQMTSFLVTVPDEKHLAINFLVAKFTLCQNDCVCLGWDGVGGEHVGEFFFFATGIL